ncbi:MAG: MraY family glycosyltransferase [Planctomycetota bacterium]|nr:MraY family glycosyltransferase [Planctomycetota bacterium]
MFQLAVLFPYAALFAGSVLLMVVLVPLLTRFAKPLGLVDKPDQHRKLHAHEIPLIGGVAILLSVLLTCLMLVLLATLGIFSSPITDKGLTSSEILQLVGLVVSAVLIVVVGVMDDRFGIRGRQKLMAQFLVAVILVGTGTWIQSVRIFDTKLDFSNAFSASANQNIEQLNEKLDAFEQGQTAQISQQQAEGILDPDKAESEQALVHESIESLKRNNFVSELVFNRLMGTVAMAITIIWIVGAINSVNLIDGADGLAGTTTFIVSLALAVISLVTNHLIEGAIALSLSGAILGFLIFNFPPARIFLGDAGSMLIGMILASLAVQSYLKEPMIYICFAPLAMLFIPILDSATAFARRLTTGRSIYSADRGHLHHLLLRHGLSNRGMVVFVGGLTLVTAVGAVLTVVLDDPSFSIVGVLAVILFLVSAKVFGFAELKLLCSRAFRFGRSFVIPKNSSTSAQSMSVQLQGSKEWGKLWDAITEFAEQRNFHRIKLDLNLPWLHESFHADWKRPTEADSEELWQTRLPLAANGRVYGRMEISGAVTNESVYLALMLMADMLETMEPAIAKLAEGQDDTIEFPEIQSHRTTLSNGIKPDQEKKPGIDRAGLLAK